MMSDQPAVNMDHLVFLLLFLRHVRLTVPQIDFSSIICIVFVIFIVTSVLRHFLETLEAGVKAIQEEAAILT